MRSALESREDVEIVGEVGDGHAAVQIAGAQQPEVVVLDLEMPGPDPEALLSGLRHAAPEAALVAFSGHRPADVAGTVDDEIALLVPNTTDLFIGDTSIRA